MDWFEEVEYTADGLGLLAVFDGRLIAVTEDGLLTLDGLLTVGGRLVLITGLGAGLGGVIGLRCGGTGFA